MAKHLIIPDTQCKDGDNFEFLSWIGQYILDQKPDTVIHLGDFADMESLSSYGMPYITTSPIQPTGQKK